MPSEHLPAIGDGNHERRGLWLGNYIIRGWLGGGRFSSVYLVEDPITGERYALKLSQSSQGDRHLAQEAERLQSITHPGVVKFFRRLEVDGRLALLLEPVEGKSLRHYIHEGPRVKGASPAEAIRIAIWLLEPLLYLHSRGILHGDLKPENMVLVRDKSGAMGVKILDLGITGEQQGCPVGTPLYMAPEAFHGHVTEKSDLWSFGIILYELLFGKTPFERIYPHAMMDIETVKSWCVNLGLCRFHSYTFNPGDPKVLEGCRACRLYGECKEDWFRDMFICKKANPTTEHFAFLFNHLLSLLQKSVLVPEPGGRSEPESVYRRLVKIKDQSHELRHRLIGGKYDIGGFLSRGAGYTLLTARNVDNGQGHALQIFDEGERWRYEREKTRLYSFPPHSLAAPFVENFEEEERGIVVYGQILGKSLQKCLRDKTLNHKAALSIVLKLLEFISTLSPGTSLSLNPENIIVEDYYEEPPLVIAGTEGYSAAFYEPLEPVYPHSNVWNIAAMLYEMMCGTDPVSALFPVSYMLSVDNQQERRRIVTQTLEQLRKEGEGLPSRLFFTEEMVSCDRCRRISPYEDRGEPYKGSPCPGNNCRKGNYKVLRFKLPIPIAMLLKNKVFFFDDKRRITAGECADEVFQLLSYNWEEMTKMVWIPPMTNRQLHYAGAAPREVRPDKREKVFLEKERIPPDFSWLPASLYSLPLVLEKGYGELSRFTGIDYHEKLRLQSIYSWSQRWDGAYIDIPDDIREIVALLIQAHLALARQLTNSGFLLRALVEYEKALELDGSNREILEETTILSGILNLRNRARHYLQRLQRLGHTRNLDMLFSYVESKNTGEPECPGIVPDEDDMRGIFG